MSFTVSKLTLRDFRNYDVFELEPHESLTVLVGPNAVGKTNVLEALQLVTEADSFRKPSWSDVIRWGSSSAFVGLTAEDGDRIHEVSLDVNPLGRRLYQVNGKAKRSVGDVRGIVPCVLFTPEDLRLVKDPAERRRAALDSIGVQLSKTYGRLKTEYDRVLRQRNALLKKDEPDEEELAPWDERLVALGGRLVNHRRGLFGRMAEEVSEMYASMSEGEQLQARYVTSWERDGAASAEEDPTKAMEMHLAATRSEERSRRSTRSGPHRDDIEFTLGGRDARSYGSQGQQRTIALAFKLSEVSVIRSVSGARPLLLLDDVMSELDDARREALTGLVGETAQTIITTTHKGYFGQDLLERARVVELG